MEFKVGDYIQYIRQYSVISERQVYQIAHISRNVKNHFYLLRYDDEFSITQDGYAIHNFFEHVSELLNEV